MWLVDPELQGFNDHQPHCSPQINNTLDSDRDSTRSENLTAQFLSDLSTRDRQTARAKAALMKDSQRRISEIIQAIEPEAVVEEKSRHSVQDYELACGTNLARGAIRFGFHDAAAWSITSGNGSIVLSGAYYARHNCLTKNPNPSMVPALQPWAHCGTGPQAPN